MFGQRQVQTTARYAQLGRHSLKVAAVRISDSFKPTWTHLRTLLLPRDVRHRFSSRALARDHNLTMIGRLLRHRPLCPLRGQIIRGTPSKVTSDMTNGSLG